MPTFSAKGIGELLIKLLRDCSPIVCPVFSGCFLCFVTVLRLKDVMRGYVSRSEYHPDIETLRELLSKVTDEQKLNILLMMKDDMKRTPIHQAADRGHKELVKVIFISLSAEQREQLLRQKDCYGNTAIGVASGEEKAIDEAYNALSVLQVLHSGSKLKSSCYLHLFDQSQNGYL